MAQATGCKKKTIFKRLGCLYIDINDIDPMQLWSLLIHGMNLWILCSSKAVVNPIVNAIFNTI